MIKPTKKTFNFQSIILTQLTIEKEGYDPATFKPKSAKFIWALCRFCGQPSRIRKQFYTQAENSACHKECRIEEQRVFSPFKRPEVREKAKNTMIARYGVPSSMLCQEIVEKARLTRRKIYNSEEKQQAIKDILSQFGEICKRGDNSFYDIVFAEKKLAIRIVYTQASSEYVLESKVARNLQLNAKKECNKNGIRLFQIFDLDWAEHKVQYLNFIKTILGLNTIKIMARKCGESTVDAKQFINDNHIQGYGYGTLDFFNLLFNNEIVASITASKHHRQCIDENNIVLNRLCFKDGVSVSGGASKLFENFKSWAKENNYKKILSWSDNCWTDGRIYEVLGFKLAEEFGPDYFYWDRDKNVYRSKQSQKKSSVNCPEGMTEREWCLSRGLFRLWDAGKHRWEFALS